MNEAESIFDAFDALTKALHEAGKRRSLAIQKRRVDAQNRPFTKARKSEAMKKYWANKKQKAIDDKEGEELYYQYVQEHCVCHLGNPPCSFCTDANYCEECDIRTREDYCPKCEKKLI